MQRRSLHCLAALVGGLCAPVFAEPARAGDNADPTGTWTWQREFQNRRIDYAIKLKCEADEVTGTFKGAPGGEVEIENGKLEGNELSFQVTRQINDRQITIHFLGKLSGDTIDGTATVEAREFEWKAIRSKVGDRSHNTVVGTWQLQVVTDNGTLGTSVKISAKDGKLAATHRGPQGGEMQATHVEYKGGQLTIKIGDEENSNSLRIVYEGKIDGNTIEGKVSYEIGDLVGSARFKGKRQAAKKD